MSMRNKKIRSLKVARHEAAHAVVSESLGYPVEAIKLTRGGRGFTVTRAPKHADPLVIGMIAMAGHAADIRWNRAPKTRVPAHDHFVVLRCGFRGRSLPTVLLLARGAVEEVHREIDMVAKELVSRDLTGKQLRALLRLAS